MFVSKYLYAEEDEGNYMLPKAQPGRTFFKNFFRYRLNGFKTDLPDKKHNKTLFAFVNVCPKTSANVPQPLKRPVSFCSK